MCRKTHQGTRYEKILTAFNGVNIKEKKLKSRCIKYAEISYPIIFSEHLQQNIIPLHWVL